MRFLPGFGYIHKIQIIVSDVVIDDGFFMVERTGIKQCAFEMRWCVDGVRCFG